MFPGQREQHDARRRERSVDPERLHHRPDGEQLDQPAGRLEQRGERGRARLPEDVQPALRHREHPPDRHRALRKRPQLAAGHEDRGEEERDAHDGHELEARHRPVRYPGGREHERRQEQRGDEVEEAVREDGPEQLAGDALAAFASPRQDAHPCELAHPPREHGVRQQADRERGDDGREGLLLRARQGLPDDDVPRHGADEDGEEVQEQGGADPPPGNGLEGIDDEAPLRAAPPEQEGEDAKAREEQRESDEPAARESHAATGSRPSARSYTSTSRMPIRSHE